MTLKNLMALLNLTTLITHKSDNFDDSDDPAKSDNFDYHDDLNDYGDSND